MFPIKILVIDDPDIADYLTKLGYQVAEARAYYGISTFLRRLHYGLSLWRFGEKHDVILNNRCLCTSISRILYRKSRHISYRGNWFVKNLSNISIDSDAKLDILKAIESD